MSHDFESGFRYDPISWVDGDSSIAAALVRTAVLGRSRAGDAELLAAEVDAVFADQAEDGSLGDTAKDTGVALLEVLRLGASPERSEVRLAAEAILHQTRGAKIAREWYEQDGKILSVHALNALCLLGMTDEPEVARSLRWLTEHPTDWNDPWRGCPWTPAIFWSALWAARDEVAVEEIIGDGMRRVGSEINAAGCLGYNDPWGFTDAAGNIDLPEAKALVAKQVPLILRSQHPDGGFGEVSRAALTALLRHGLFEPLRDRPPVPPEWREVREVPLARGLWFSLSWDGHHLWSFDIKSDVAAAIDPADGRVLRRVAIANCSGIACWDGALAAVGQDPKELKKIDPDTGEILQRISLDHMESIIEPTVVGGRVVVGDRGTGCVSIIDPSGGEEPRQQCLAGPFPACLATEGEHLWHADRWAPAIIKSDLQGRLLDWGGKPFGIQGLAFDGRYLWALDGESRRIVAIEKTR
ncbi:MAG: hypothetical protein JSU87_11650 [Gemmatimonadota bacterium]|nr:MAG: hypothetical protein JSU87_11650 [Gemmatimonadota bacterium]